MSDAGEHPCIARFVFDHGCIRADGTVRDVEELALVAAFLVGTAVADLGRAQEPQTPVSLQSCRWAHWLARP